jgi:hypothetical protein
MDSLTTKERKVFNNMSRVLDGTVFLGDEVQDLIDEDVSLASLIGDGLLAGTPVNAVAATMALAVTGVVIDGETVSIDDDDYEFLADAAQSLTDPANIAVDITGGVTGSVVTLTIDTQVLSGDTMTLEGKEYTFVPNETANADGEIDVGTDLATCQAAIVAAVNGSDGHNVAHPEVECAAFGGNDAILTVLVGGVAGDAVTCTETFDEVTNIFSGATFASGADCIAATAITALAAANVTYDTAGVAAVDGAGDTMDLTADVAGVLGNAIVLAETGANLAFTGAAVLMTGGVDGTVGAVRAMLVDSSYIYVALAENTIVDANWVRAAIASF